MIVVHFIRRAMLVGTLAAFGCQSAWGDTLKFLGGSGSWSVLDNWTTATLPTAADVAEFTLVPGPATVLLTSDQNPAAGLVFSNPGSTLIRGDASNNRRLLPGAEGIVVAATAGEVTLGSSTTNNRLGILLQASQTWENNRAFADGDTLVWESGGGARIVLNGHTLSFAGTGRTRLGHVIEGEGNLVIDGGAVRLDGGNAGNRFAGTVTLNQGLLQLASSSVESSGFGPLGLATNVFVINGGTITPRGGFGVTRTVANPMVWAGDFSVAPPPDVDVQTLRMTGAVTLQGSRTVNVEGFTGIAVRSVASGTEAFGLTKTGRNGTLILEGTNTYLGPTTASQGALAIESTAALPRWNVPGAYTVADAAALTFGPSFVPGGAAFDPAITTMIGTGNIAANAAIGLDVTEGTNTVVLSSSLDLATLVGSRPFAKSGFGSLALTGPSTYLGPTRLYGGFVNLDAAEVPGGGPLGIDGPIEFLGGALRATVTNTHDYSNRFSADPGQLYAIDTNGQDVTWASLATAPDSSLNKLGAGSLRLPNLTQVDGTLRVFGGTIDLGVTNNVSVGMLATSGNVSGIEVQFGGRLTVGSSNAGNTFSGTLVPTGVSPTTQVVEKIGTGTWTLSADQTYLGDTIIAGGSLQLGAGGSGGTTGALAGNVVNNAVLVFNRSNDAFSAGTISGSGQVVKQGSGTVSLTAQNTYAGGTTFVSGLLGLEAAQTGTTSGPLGGDGPLEFFGGGIRYSATNTHDYSPRFTDTAGQAIRVDTNGQDATWTAAIAAAGISLQKDGFGKLSLTGASSFGGIVTVNGGELAFPAGESNVVLGGLAGTAGTVSLAGNLRVGSAGILTTFAGNLVNTGSGVFEKVGTARLNLSGDNSGFTGDIILAGGNLRVASANAIGSTGIISFTGGGLQFTAENTTDYSGRFSQASGQVYNLDTNDQNVLVATPLTSVGGSLTKGGQGTLTLATANTYDGGTTLTNGTLLVSVPGGLGTGAISIGGGATLALGAGAHALGQPTALTGAGTRTVLAPAGASVRIQGMARPEGAGNVILVISGDGDVSVEGAIGDLGTSGTSFGRVGPGGTTSLLGLNAFGGTVNVDNGTLVVNTIRDGQPSSIGTGALTGALINPGLAADSGTLRYVGSDDAVTARQIRVGRGTAATDTGGAVIENAGPGTLTLSAPQLIFPTNDTAARELTVGGSGAGAVSGVISDMSATGGTLALAKAGAGTWLLAGANTYTGPTTVAGGTLVIAGDQTAATGAVTVASGATLAGGGTVGGSVTLGTGATLSPGASPGTLTVVGGVTLSAGGNYNWQILDATGTAGSTTGWDLLSVDGALSISATSADPFKLNLWSLSTTLPDVNGNAVNFSPTQGYTWTIASAAGGITGFSSDAFAINTAATNGTGGFTNALGGGSFSLAVAGNNLNLVFAPGAGPTDIVIDVPSGSQTQAQAGYASIAAANSVMKTGAGTVVFDAANAYTGPTTVSAGTLEVANAGALGGTNVTVDTGATLAIASGTTMKSPAVIVDGGTLSATTLAVNNTTGITSLAINAGTISGAPVLTVGAGGLASLVQDARVVVGVGGLSVDQAGGGGRLDLGAGQISIAPDGITAADLRADIIAGRAGGAWTGSTGITSSTAAASGGTRVVGYVVAADGSAKVSFAASGDVDLSGAVNVFDLVSINSSGKYGTGTSAVWNQGDFNYDGVTNVFDLVSVNTAGVYGQGNYFPAGPSVGSAAAVPEPGLTGLAVLAALGAAAWAHPLRRRATHQAP